MIIEKTINEKWWMLRHLIIILGEYKQWWTAKILTESGIEMLAYVLPKTQNKAAFQLATEICRLEHDKQIGPGKYHIFRLPQKWEEEIFFNLKNQHERLKVLGETDILNELFKMSSSISISASKGPIMVGLHNELDDPAVFQSIAKHYYEAFRNNYKTYPYLN